MNQKMQDQYHALIYQTLSKHTSIPDVDNVAASLTSKLLALQKSPQRTRKKTSDKNPFMIMHLALINKFGAKKAKSFLLSLVENERLYSRSIYIPSPKRIQKL
jgi:hypothetical protein